MPRSLAASRPPSPQGKRSERRPNRLRLVAATASIGLIAALVVAHPDTPWGGLSGASASLDGWLHASGLGIEQVSLEGHRFTPDADIFEALDLPSAKSMVRFNGGEAAARILKLPWIQRVQIIPLVPKGLHVVVTERAPFAIWEPAPSDAPDGRRMLIDQSGRVLSAVGPDAFKELPRFRGAGATVAAADLNATLALFPELAGRVLESERIGERRWVLALAHGLRVHLPVRQEAAAIQRLAQLQQRHGLLDKDIVTVDMRDPAISVRLRTPMTALAPAEGVAGVASGSGL